MSKAHTAMVNLTRIFSPLGLELKTERHFTFLTDNDGNSGRSSLIFSGAHLLFPGEDLPEGSLSSLPRTAFPYISNCASLRTEK